MEAGRPNLGSHWTLSGSKAMSRAGFVHTTAGTLALRRARSADAPAISALIQGLAAQFLVDPEGTDAERLLATVTPEAIAGYIRSPRYLYLAGLVSRQLAGVVAIRDRAHLFHLFVGRPFQRHGVGRALWQRASAETLAVAGGAAFTVNATLPAVAAYERLGFCADGPIVEQDGIAYVPMRAGPTRA